jgi:hypothetical protein
MQHSTILIDDQEEIKAQEDQGKPLFIDNTLNDIDNEDDDV